MSAKVTSRGRVTIPKPVRDLLGLVQGTLVDFHCTVNGTVVLTRADEKRPAGRFNRLRGHAGEGFSTEAIMAQTRGGERL